VKDKEATSLERTAAARKRSREDNLIAWGSRAPLRTTWLTVCLHSLPPAPRIIDGYTSDGMSLVRLIAWLTGSLALVAYLRIKLGSQLAH
jgi:hypothetical protein